MKKTYNHEFYNSQLTQSKNSADFIVPIINKWFKPKTVVDVGCGIGAWLEIWKEQANVIEIKGLDAKFVDRSLMRINVDQDFLEVDLNQDLPKLKPYDLAMCLEVAEHLEENRANSFISDLTKLSNVILFSAAVPGQEGTYHLNEQYIGYWIDKFKTNNFKCYDIVRPLIWDVSSVAWWYRQNTVLFIKEDFEVDIDFDSLQNFNGYDLIQKDLLQYKDKKFRKYFQEMENKHMSIKKFIKKIIRS